MFVFLLVKVSYRHMTSYSEIKFVKSSQDRFALVNPSTFQDINFMSFPHSELPRPLSTILTSETIRIESSSTTWFTDVNRNRDKVKRMYIFDI
jgi:hypothetical protein